MLSLPARRPAAVVLALLAPAVAADRANATLAWSDQRTQGIMVAADDGSRPRLVGRGRDVVVSPDGSLIAYSATEPGTFRTETYIVGGGGIIAPELVGEGFSPKTFTPDGKQLVVARLTRTGKEKGLSAVPVAGGPAVSLTSRQAFVAGFSAPGTVTVSIDLLDSSLARVDEVSLQDGRRVRTRLAGAEVSDFSSPALAASGRLAYVLRLRDSAVLFQTRVTGGPPSTVPPTTDEDVLVQSPVGWSADARLLLIAEQRVSEPGTAVIFDTRTGRRRVIAEGLAAIYSISRDGRFVLAERGSRISRIVSIPVAGGRARELARHAEDAAWSR